MSSIDVEKPNFDFNQDELEAIWANGVYIYPSKKPSKTSVFFNAILVFLEKISDAIYGFFYDKKMARVGRVLTTPIYWAERLTIWVCQFFEK